MADRNDDQRVRVLFLCTGNSCRSQMAEGWTRALLGPRVVAASAGTRPGRLDHRAVRVMAEAGVDISRQSPKSVSDLAHGTFDLVVTVCDSAKESCPVLPSAARVVHRPFDDPPHLAAAAPDESTALEPYRRVRDEIRAFIASLPGLIDRTGIHPDHTERMMNTPTSIPDRSCCSSDCCGRTPSTPPPPHSPPATSPPATEVHDRVREGYAAIARTGQWSGIQPSPSTSGCCGGGAGGSGGGGGGGEGGGGGCCGPSTLTADQVARAVGYSAEELATLPEGANMGLSCGNPTALASLRPGETVLDLGAGGGFDCFIAGPRVGASGRVIGVDMTPDMVSKARRNLASYRAQTGLDNVEFRLGEIENLPVADSSIDVVISNCVLNLSPDKPRVWREIARILRPGGRIAISDLALLRPLPESVRSDVEALIGCIAGAALIGLTERWAREAGLADVAVHRKAGYVDAMVNGSDPLYQSVLAKLPPGSRVGDYVASVEVTARKP